MFTFPEFPLTILSLAKQFEKIKNIKIIITIKHSSHVRTCRRGKNSLFRLDLFPCSNSPSITTDVIRSIPFCYCADVSQNGFSIQHFMEHLISTMNTTILKIVLVVLETYLGFPLNPNVLVVLLMID